MPKDLRLVLKKLIDSSTLVDIGRSVKHSRATWSQNTLRHLMAYQAHHSKLTVSGLTIYEQLDGMHRDGQLTAAKEFSLDVLPKFEVIYPDYEVLAMGAEINAVLSKSRQIIGVVDTLIAATAIVHQWPLVNANTKHFPRIVAAGFSLTLENWRDA